MPNVNAILEKLIDEDGTIRYRRNNFRFFRTWYETVQLLPDDQKLPFVMMVLDYGLEGIEPTEDHPCYSHLPTIKYQIDSMNKNYEHSIKGGRPPKTGDPFRDQLAEAVYNAVEESKVKTKE